MNTITRASGYVGMAVIGGLLALGIHERFVEPRSVMTSAVGQEAPIPVKYVNLPSPAGGTMLAPDFTGAAETSVNAVVHVTTEADVQRQDPFAGYFWGYRQLQPQVQKGAGSGVIMSDDGFIVTNNHVVEGADRIMVHLNDKRQFEAKVIGRDPSTDIALIKIDAKDLPTLAYGNSDDVKLGQWVLAIGYPLNLDVTVTSLGAKH